METAAADLRSAGRSVRSERQSAQQLARRSGSWLSLTPISPVAPTRFEAVVLLLCAERVVAAAASRQDDGNLATLRTELWRYATGLSEVVHPRASLASLQWVEIGEGS
jgi:hypothetical protein